MSTNKFAFTFGVGQAYYNHYVVFTGTYDECRYQMFESFGPNWAFQYTYDEEFLRIAEKWGWTEIK